jgi:hypothetical protein
LKNKLVIVSNLKKKSLHYSSRKKVNKKMVGAGWVAGRIKAAFQKHTMIAHNRARKYI